MRRRNTTAAGNSARASSRNRCNSDMLALLPVVGCNYEPTTAPWPARARSDRIERPFVAPRIPGKARQGGPPGGVQACPWQGTEGRRSSLILSSRFRGNDNFNQSDGALQRPDYSPAPDICPLAVGSDDDRTVEHEFARLDPMGAFLGDALQRALV